MPLLYQVKKNQLHFILGVFNYYLSAVCAKKRYLTIETCLNMLFLTQKYAVHHLKNCCYLDLKRLGNARLETLQALTNFFFFGQISDFSLQITIYH